MTVFTTRAICFQGPIEHLEISYSHCVVIGEGGTGVVSKAKLCDTGEFVAIKRLKKNFSLLQELARKDDSQVNARTPSSILSEVPSANSEECKQSSDQGQKTLKIFVTREVKIMRSLKHRNIVELKYVFNSPIDHAGRTFLNLVMEYVPETLEKVARQCNKSSEQSMPTIFVKLYIYQLFQSLAYIHSLGICHRSIKSANILVNPDTGVLKLCDFGRAKYLVEGQSRSPHTCSRTNCAPELLFGSENYSTKIDVWSAGCVLVELFSGKETFHLNYFDDSDGRLAGIIRILGTPLPEQIQDINPNIKSEYLPCDHLPCIKALPWHFVLGSKNVTPEVIVLVSRILVYSPLSRISAVEALNEPFFDELKNPNTKLPNGDSLPPLFDIRLPTKKN